MVAKINYFDIRGVAEPLRYLLAYGEESFEDNRIPKDKWPAIKPTTPFGQLPVLELNGKTYTQSVAIARYLGHKYGIAGSNIEEAFEIDQNVDFINDIRIAVKGFWNEQDPELKAKKHEEFLQKNYPLFTDKLDEIVKKNKGHIAAGKLTWGDFWFAGFYNSIKVILKATDLDEKYPRLKKLYDSIVTLPKVKKYIDNAPKTDF